MRSGACSRRIPRRRVFETRRREGQDLSGSPLQRCTSHSAASPSIGDRSADEFSAGRCWRFPSRGSRGLAFHRRWGLLEFKKGVAAPPGDVFSTACSAGVLAPEYFETHLREIRARKLSEVASLQGAGGPNDDVVYIAEEDVGSLEAWAVGPVVAIAGLIVLLVGALVFRRALGPRRVDIYSDSKNKTREVDGGEARRFGETGGHVDDGSVDSAFYSDEDDGSDLEETEKERRMRRKRKEKASEQRGNGGSNGRSRKKGSEGRSRGDGDKRSRQRREAKLAASSASADSNSLGRSSVGSGGAEDAGDHRANRLSKGREGERKKSSSGDRREKSDSDRRKERKARRKAREQFEIV